MKLLPTLFKPLCNQQPKTSSFRVMSMKYDIYKTINSLYFDQVEQESDWVETPESWFISSSNSGSLSTTDIDELVNQESHVEAIVRGAQHTSSNNQRLFFDPGESDSPRLLTHNKPQHKRLKKSVALSVESKDPYEDFKSSMEEMVDDLGVKDDWEGLEDLLRWYLQVNGKDTHGYIINAFVDLIGNVIGKNNEISTSASISSVNHGGFHVDSSDHHREISKSTTFSSAASTLSSLGSNITLDDHMIC